MDNVSRHAPRTGRGREQARLAGQLAALAGERWDLVAGPNGGDYHASRHTLAKGTRMDNVSRHAPRTGRGREKARLAGQLAALAGERWDLAAGPSGSGDHVSRHPVAQCW